MSVTSTETGITRCDLCAAFGVNCTQKVDQSTSILFGLIHLKKPDEITVFVDGHPAHFRTPERIESCPAVKGDYPYKVVAAKIRENDNRGRGIMLAQDVLHGR